MELYSTIISVCLAVMPLDEGNRGKCQMELMECIEYGTTLADHSDLDKCIKETDFQSLKRIPTR